MARQTTVTAKPKVPLKKRKSGAGAAAAVTAKKTTTTTTITTANKTRSRIIVKSKGTANKGPVKLKKGGSALSTASKKATTTKKNSKQSSAVSTNSRNTSSSVSKSSTASSSNGTASSTSSGRRDLNRSTVEQPPKTPLDRSTISFPYDVRINGVSSMLNTIQKSTPKLRKVLLDECDVILECRFCKNLFRSMPNFLCHKQTFCKNMFDPSPETSSVQHLLHRSSNPVIEYNFDTTAINTTDQHQSSSSSPSSSRTQPVVDETACLLVSREDSTTRSPLTFLTQIEQSTNNKTRQSATTTAAEENGGGAKENVCLVIEPVQNRQDGVVFQRRADSSTSGSIDVAACDSSAATSDTREVVDRDTAILGPDGRVMCTGTAKGIEKIVKHLTAQIEITQNRMVRSSTNGFPGNCDICKTVFTSEKAFRQHKRDAPDCVGQSPCRQPNKTDGHSYLEEADSSSIHSDELQEQSRKTFVKKLFAPQSPFKSSGILQSPLKSPLFARKLLQSNSPKTSPYKKVLAKAVKQIRLPEPEPGSSSHLRSPEYSTTNSYNNSFKPPQFFCIRCSRGFKTTCEMSVHISECTGSRNFNELPKVAQGSAERRKIGIELRRNYFKTPPVPSDDHPYTCPSASSTQDIEDQSFNATKSVNESLYSSVVENTSGIRSSGILICSKKLEVLDCEVNTLATFGNSDATAHSPAELNDKGKENDSFRRIKNEAKVNGNNNSLSSSESEADRESISNNTDSGISLNSTPATSEDQYSREEIQSIVAVGLELDDSSLNETSEQGKTAEKPAKTAVSTVSNLKRTEGHTVSAEKVLRSNSTVASLKRKSHRILSKSKTLSENGSSQVIVKKKK